MNDVPRREGAATSDVRVQHSEGAMRAALRTIHQAALGESTASYMSIPADPRRDADLILSAAIDELVALRKQVGALADDPRRAGQQQGRDQQAEEEEPT